MKIFKLPTIKKVYAMPEYNLVAVDFFPFRESLDNLDSKHDIRTLINDYKDIRNSVLLPDGEGNLYRWIFESQKDMIKFLEDMNNS